MTLQDYSPDAEIGLIRRSVVVAVAVLGLLAAAVVWQCYRVADPVVLRVSPEVTYIVEPVDEFGVPDYAAWLERRAPEPLREGNAVSRLVEMIGLENLSAVQLDQRRDFAVELGLDPDAVASGLKSSPYEDEGGESDWYDAVTTAIEAGDLPSASPGLDAYVAKNSAALHALEQALDGRNFWVPRMPGFGHLGAVLCPREALVLLAVRARDAIAAGNLEAAWRDGVRFHRAVELEFTAKRVLGRFSFGDASALALTVAQKILTRDLPAELLERMRTDLAALVEPQPLAETVDGLERVMTLAQTLELLQQAEGGEPDHVEFSSVDVNWLLGRTNAGLDSIVAACRQFEPERTAQIRLALAAEHEQVQRSVAWSQGFGAQTLLQVRGPEARRRAATEFAYSLLAPGSKYLDVVQREVKALRERRLAQLAVALVIDSGQRKGAMPSLSSVPGVTAAMSADPGDPARLADLSIVVISGSSAWRLAFGDVSLLVRAR